MQNGFLIKIDRCYFSHPEKCYVNHVRKIADSFDDLGHKIVAEYHDIGKLSNAFQNFITCKKKSNESLEEFQKRRNRLRTTHALESAFLYFNDQARKDVAFLANFYAIWKHHGALPNILEEMERTLEVIGKEINSERYEKIKEIANRASITLKNDTDDFEDFFDNWSDQLKKLTLDFSDFLLFKERYSRLILADKFEAIFSKPYENLPFFSDEQVEQYIKTIHRIIDDKQKISPNKHRTEVRKRVFDNFEKSSNANIYLIKAPTGVGKTFIALELALKIIKQTKKKRRIVTALPFTSIIDQTHQEYEKIIGEGNVLKYHHLTKYSDESIDETEQFSQKVFLADIWHEHFIVTTFNQLLFTIFSNRNRDNLKLETLRDSVVIIDEVQNIPRVLLKSIVQILQYFAKEYAIHFIIMSATMPALEELLDEAVLLSEEWFYSNKESRYRLHYREDLNDLDVLAQEINSYSEQSVLCVVNTVEKAKRLFDKLDGEEGDTKFLLTTHQIPLHRKEIIAEIEKKLKEIDDKSPKIKLVATQLIEAGVDLDFDIGFREFAPFGSIIQMAGRVNREGKKDIKDAIVFDFIDIGRGEDVKRLPYHMIDLQEEKIKEWLKEKIEEIEIFERIDEYFQTTQKQTTSSKLEVWMKNLAFQTLFDTFNSNFMPNQPWKATCFVEQWDGQFKQFIEKREEILNSLENRFEAINRIKELEKELALYTISLNEKLIKELQIQYHGIYEMFGYYILPYGSPKYSKYRGFNLKSATLEEVLGFD